MTLRSSETVLNPWRVGLGVLALIASVGAGAAYLVSPSPLSPLIVAGAIIALGLGAAWLRNPVVALYAALFVVLIPEGLIPDRIHSIATRATLLIALGSWLVDAISRRRKILWTHTALVMLGFLLWSTVTLFWAPSLDLGIERVVQYVLRLILFLLLVVNEINTEEALGGLMRTLALGGWVLVLAGVATVLFTGYERGTQFAVLGMNENQYGVSILVTMPGVLWIARRATEPNKGLNMPLSIVFILLSVIMVAISGSRGSAISMLSTLLAFWLLKPTRPWGSLGLLILAGGMISAPLFFSTTIERFVEEAGGVLGGRLAIWQASWLLIRDHPWRGVGIGNASYALLPYYERLVGIFRSDFRSIHNPVLAIWAEAGLPGLLLYLGVLASAVWAFIRKVRQERETASASLAFYFALVASVFVGFMLSWMKGGGMEYHRSYFLMLALLLIPSQLATDDVKHRP